MSWAVLRLIAQFPKPDVQPLPNTGIFVTGDDETGVRSEVSLKNGNFMVS